MQVAGVDGRLAVIASLRHHVSQAGALLEVLEVVGLFQPTSRPERPRSRAGPAPCTFARARSDWGPAEDRDCVQFPMLAEHRFQGRVGRVAAIRPPAVPVCGRPSGRLPPAPSSWGARASRTAARNRLRRLRGGPCPAARCPPQLAEPRLPARRRRSPNLLGSACESASGRLFYGCHHTLPVRVPQRGRTAPPQPVGWHERVMAARARPWPAE